MAAGVELVKLGDEYNKAVNQISASTGATGTELEELGAIAQKVYTNNFGDSLEDVAEGLSIVQKTTGLVGDELQKATESGFALRDTFGSAGIGSCCQCTDEELWCDSRGSI